MGDQQNAEQEDWEKDAALLAKQKLKVRLAAKETNRVAMAARQAEVADNAAAGQVAPGDQGGVAALAPGDQGGVAALAPGDQGGVAAPVVTPNTKTSTDTTNEGNLFTRFATGLTGRTKNLFKKTSQPIKEDPANTLFIDPIDENTYKIVKAGENGFNKAYTLKRPGLGSCYAVVPKSVPNQDQTGTGALTGNDAAPLQDKRIQEQTDFDNKILTTIKQKIEYIQQNDNSSNSTNLINLFRKNYDEYNDLMSNKNTGLKLVEEMNKLDDNDSNKIQINSLNDNLNELRTNLRNKYEKTTVGGKTRKRKHTKRRPNRRKNGFKSRARRN
jgi:hypothetical protein